MSQSCLLTFEKVQNSLYCDIREANASRNQAGGGLHPSQPPSIRVACVNGLELTAV